MNKLKITLLAFLMAICFVPQAQQSVNHKFSTEGPKIIAIVNRADWCPVCKANGERFGQNIMPYTSKGLMILVNDLTNDSTTAKSIAELKKYAVYKQIYEAKRKGVGKIMQACGLIHGKNKSMASGIVTFIDLKTLKILNETSIAVTDQEMKSIIDTLLIK